MNADFPAAPLRVAELEDWIDTLPYADFEGTCAIVAAALRHTADQDLKAGLRLELVQAYWRPYYYMLSSQVKPGNTRTAFRSVSQIQGRLEALKEVAAELASAAKIGAREAMAKKSLFGGESGPPVDGFVLAARLYAHAIALAYHGYKQVPPGLWRELYSLYRFTEELSVLTEAAKDPEGNKNDTTTVLAVCVQIIATAKADPFHLPPGAVWEIYDQLRLWSGDVEAGPMRSVKNPAGLFVLDLDADLEPVPCARFTAAEITGDYRLLNFLALSDAAQELRKQLDTGMRVDKLHLRKETADLLLEHVQRSWGLPPKRYFPRKKRDDTVLAVAGYNGAWFFLNGEKEFQADSARTEENAEIGDDAYSPDSAAVPISYESVECSYVDEGPGGISIMRSTASPDIHTRVGELIATRDPGDEARWKLGVIRWLTQEDTGYRLGIQSFPRQCDPVSIRSDSGTENEQTEQRGFLMVDPAMTQGLALIVPRNLHDNDRLFQVKIESNRLLMKAGTLRDRTIGFDHFSCRS